MLVNGLRLCVGCMHFLNQNGECEYCKMKQEQYVPSPRCLLPGTLLADRYIVGKVIGEGSTGITYIAYDRLQEITVAIKEFCPEEIVLRDTIRGTDSAISVYPESLNDEYQIHLKKFRKEADLLAKFSNVDGIVSVRDYFNENKTAYLVMEYISGINLNEYIEKNGRMNGQKVLSIMRPIIKSMGSIHKRGIVHRDICPDNLIIADNKLTLIDFGTARLNNHIISRSITVMFKRGFSPVEQYRRRGKQGAWTDVYSLCATMYYMMTGDVPDEAVERLFDDKLDISVLDETGLSEKEKIALIKGLAVKAQNRYLNMELLYEGLYGEAV